MRFSVSLLLLATATAFKPPRSSLVVAPSSSTRPPTLVATRAATDAAAAEVFVVPLPIDGSTEWNFAWTASGARDDAAAWPSGFAPSQLLREAWPRRTWR
jgi:hypothetical protein